MEQVKVLLSSYNGADHIREQIDSILNQTWGNVKLYVRDDGSTDGTRTILREYEKEGKLTLFTGKNVGFIKSFLMLLRHCGDADYFAYADQDDVWLPDKLAMAVERLSAEEAGKPLLYFSNYYICEGNMEHACLAAPESVEKHPTFANALVDCMPLGFNSVLNRTLKNLICEHTPKHSCGHDWWTYMVAQGLGTVIYDGRPTVYYRRTGHNVSAGGMGFLKFQIWRFKKFFLNSYFANIRKMLREYGHYYAGCLSPEDAALLSCFTERGFCPGKILKKVFYPKRFRQGLFDELVVRGLFLIGRL